MKRIILSFAMVFGLVLSLTPFANAATEGCPDTWKIDTTSRAGYDQLLQAKNRLGSDLALGQPVTQYLNYAGELGALVAPKSRGALTLEDVYLYGKTQVQWKIDVQVKNCPGTTSFVINLGTLTDSFGIKDMSLNVDPQAWANANESSFVDFTKAAQFGACIEAWKLRFSPPNIRAELRGTTLLLTGFGLMIRRASYPIPCGLRGPTMGYQDLTPECRSLTESFDRSVAIKKGGSCDIALSVSPRNGDLVVFPKYTIKAKDFEVVVKCVKGKLTKKFTTYRGYEFRVKCPTGYARDMNY
jgi:hypothetical protein